MAYAIKQTVTNGGMSSGVATFALGTTTTGSLIVVVVATSNVGSGVSTITDTTGNTYTKIDAIVVSAGSRKLDLWYAQNITGGTTPSITVTAVTNTDTGNVGVREYSGVAAVALDKHTITTGTGTAISSGATAATTSNNELVFGYSFGATTTLTAGTGYGNLTLLNSTGTTRAAIEDKMQTSTQTETATFTGSGTTYGAGVATFVLIDQSSGTNSTNFFQFM